MTSRLLRVTTANMKQDVVRMLALNEELNTAHKLIVAGFGALQEVDMGNTFYHQPHQLIASGLERLMKCYISLVIQGRTGAFPNVKEMKALGHDLEVLLDRVVNEYYGGTETSPLLKADLEFLRSNPTLSQCVKILSDFGKKGRYYNLDVVAGAKAELLDPTEEWQQLETSIEDPVPIMDDTERLYRDYYPRVNAKLVSVMERLVRAIALQFTLGGHPDPQKNLSSSSPIFSGFGNLRDEGLGTKDYRRSVQILKQDQYNWLRRTEEKILGGRHPTKVIHRGQFEGEWPFRAEKVIVECRGKWCAIVNVDGYAFALNGQATGHFKLPSPHAAGMAILGRSLSPFTDIARSLGESVDSELKSVSETVAEVGRSVLKKIVARSSQTKKGRPR